MHIGTRAMFFSTVRDALRAGSAVDDETFDKVYPGAVRELSRTHWTPVAVAQAAARMLVDPARPPRLVLDVGSGAGKMCIIGGLTTGAVFVGVEQRRWLTEIASRAAGHLRAEATTCFLHRDALEVDWAGYDAVYLFNPFYEHIDDDARIDCRVELGTHVYSKCVLGTRERLTAMRAGSRVVTYHGFGASVPECFHLERTEKAGSDVLELWVRD